MLRQGYEGAGVLAYTSVRVCECAVQVFVRVCVRYPVCVRCEAYARLRVCMRSSLCFEFRRPAPFASSNRHSLPGQARLGWLWQRTGKYKSTGGLEYGAGTCGLRAGNGGCTAIVGYKGYLRATRSYFARTQSWERAARGLVCEHSCACELNAN